MQNIYIANYNDLKIYFYPEHDTQKYAHTHTVSHCSAFYKELKACDIIAV